MVQWSYTNSNVRVHPYATKRHERQHRSRLLSDPKTQGLWNFQQSLD